jgi:hypothetical protein
VQDIAPRYELVDPAALQERCRSAACAFYRKRRFMGGFVVTTSIFSRAEGTQGNMHATGQGRCPWGLL